MCVQVYSYGLQPYCGYSNQDAVELIRTHQLLTCPAGCSPRLYALLVDCWHRVPSARPRFDVLRHRLRYCAAEAGSGSASGGSATTAGCCGTDGLYQPHHPVCPPAACLRYSDQPTAQVSAGPVERYTTNCTRREVSPMNLADDTKTRWPNGDAVAVGTDAGVVTPAPRLRQAASAVSGNRQCPAVNQSTTSTSASTTPRNSHHVAHSSSSSASETRPRPVMSSELERLTSHPHPQ